jgi:hypothetical protein
VATAFQASAFQNNAFQIDSGAAPAAPTTGATYLTAAELRRYRAYWRALGKIEKKRFKTERAREKAFSETVERAYRQAQGIEDDLPGVLAPLQPRPTPTLPTVAGKTITYLEKLQPRTKGVLEAALSELFYLQLRIDMERQAVLDERRALEDEEDFLMLLS